MSFDLSEFLTEGLISSVNNGLIPSDLATVSDAITAYKATQVSADKTASGKRNDGGNLIE